MISIVALRKHGPITSGLYCCAAPLLQPFAKMGNGGWAPAFAEATDSYLFLLTGLRFSMNAAMPSARSSSAKVA